MKEQLKKILKPKEYKPLDIPRIRDLDLTKGRSNGHVEKLPVRSATIIYQRKG